MHKGRVRVTLARSPWPANIPAFHACSHACPLSHAHTLFPMFRRISNLHYPAFLNSQVTLCLLMRADGADIGPELWAAWHTRDCVLCAGLVCICCHSSHGSFEWHLTRYVLVMCTCTPLLRLSACLATVDGAWQTDSCSGHCLRRWVTPQHCVSLCVYCSF